MTNYFLNNKKNFFKIKFYYFAFFCTEFFKMFLVVKVIIFVANKIHLQSTTSSRVFFDVLQNPLLIYGIDLD